MTEMAKLNKFNDSAIMKMFISIGGVYAVAIFLLFDLTVAENIQPNVFLVVLFASLAVVLGLLYSVYRISKRPRFMFSLN